SASLPARCLPLACQRQQPREPKLACCPRSTLSQVCQRHRKLRRFSPAILPPGTTLRKDLDCEPGRASLPPLVPHRPNPVAPRERLSEPPQRPPRSGRSCSRDGIPAYKPDEDEAACEPGSETETGLRCWV